MNNKSSKKIPVKWQASDKELDQRQRFFELFKNSPIPDDELLQNVGLYLKRQDLTRILFLNELYQRILPIHGVVMELGVRWGHNLAIFQSLRGIYEPFNHSRKIIGFDTFSGFPSVHTKDGQASDIKKGGLGVTTKYENYLDQILAYHESESPIPHMKKFELVKGDAITTTKKYLRQNPHTIIALAYFDLDLYEPTKACLHQISNYLTKGSIIGFDQLCSSHYPGETLALKEVLGLDKFSIKRSRFSAQQSYLVVE